MLKKEARKEVASAMESRQIEMASELDKRGRTMAFRIANQTARENRDIIGMPCIRDKNGYLKTEIGERLDGWRRYCERLMNVENDWDGEVDYVHVEGLWEKVMEKEVMKTLKGMKKGKSSGPSEMFSNEVCAKELCRLVNGLLTGENMPDS